MHIEEGGFGFSLMILSLHAKIKRSEKREREVQFTLVMTMGEFDLNKDTNRVKAVERI